MQKIETAYLICDCFQCFRVFKGFVHSVENLYHLNYTSLYVFYESRCLDEYSGKLGYTKFV